MPAPLRRAALLASLALALLPATGQSQSTTTFTHAQIEFFEKKVRPVLVANCLSCHGATGEKVRGGLRLTSRAELLAGGDTGPAVVPGDPKASPLVRALTHDGDLKMPPKGKLNDAEIADLTRWVKEGAAWPGTAPAAAPTSPRPGLTEEQKRFWAFQPIRRPTVPTTGEPGTPGPNPIDAFVLARLRASGLAPAPPADRRTLIRRVTYDLTGLPPTPEEVESFVSDPSPDAFEKLVDRLLATPAYGERWARHWLDVARYADSNGLDENTAFKNAYRYRDYVIRSLNADKPYDLFIKEQLAGDLMPPDPNPTINSDRLVATGFLVLGPKLLAEVDKQKMVMDIVDEQIDVISKAMLGLTVSCARCHDHKFDPIPTRDYYALAGIFKSTRTMATLATVARALERPLAGPQGAEKLAAHQQLVAAANTLTRKVKSQPAGFTALGGAAGLHGLTLKLDRDLAVLKAATPQVPMALAVQDEPQPGDVKVHIRGNHLTLGELAPRGFLSILTGDRPPNIPTSVSGRLQLAEWVASPTNPLTARVIVNRVWQHHFGEGLVRSPDNFGTLGERPTHPELLDWLAATFIEDGWSLKSLHRRILLSTTYRMSAVHDERAALRDPDNRLLWRFPQRRLEAEAIRDAILAVAGTLDRTPGGSLLPQESNEYVPGEDPARYATARRSIYLPVIRNNVFDFFQTFDFVEPHVPNGRRASTVIAPQALYLMNSPFVTGQATKFAELLLKLPGTDADRIRNAYLRAYSRPPRQAELTRATAFIQQYEATLPDSTQARLKAWAAWCHVLLASSEFIHLN